MERVRPEVPLGNESAIGEPVPRRPGGIVTPRELLDGLLLRTGIALPSLAAASLARRTRCAARIAPGANIRAHESVVCPRRDRALAHRVLAGNRRCRRNISLWQVDRVELDVGRRADCEMRRTRLAHERDARR